LTLARLWTFLAIGLPVLGTLLVNLQSVDLAYHLRAGNLILSTGAIPANDSFTFTAAGLPWQDQQWGAEVVLALVYGSAGWSGLVILRALLVGVLFGFVLDMCRRETSERTAALLTLASFAVAIVTLALRPQLIAMVLFALTLWMVTRRRERPGWLWLVVPISLAWANVHGSFVFGPLLVGLAFLEDWIDPATRATAGRTLLVAAASAAATLVNPFGVGVWQYAAGIATNPLITTRITEWQPTTPQSPEGAAFTVSVVLMIALVVGALREHRRLAAVSVVWLLPFAAIGARAVRGLAWWPIVAAITAARLLGHNDAARVRAEPADPPLLRRLNFVIALLIVVSGIALLPLWRAQDPGLRAPVGVVGNAPAGITAALRDLVRPGDRLFAPQPWGSWFEFAIPDASVFIDSRIELFPADVWDDYDAITNGSPDWRAKLAAWDVTVVVASDRLGSTPLGDRLSSDPNWRLVYSDVDGRVFVRAITAARPTPLPAGESRAG
jgi:hypothetical protein